MQQEGGAAVLAEIMVPLAATAQEVRICKDIINETAAAVQAEMGITVDYMVGTMIELPRAALVADEIAAEAEFFSFMMISYVTGNKLFLLILSEEVKYNCFDQNLQLFPRVFTMGSEMCQTSILWKKVLSTCFDN